MPGRRCVTELHPQPCSELARTENIQSSKAAAAGWGMEKVGATATHFCHPPCYIVL